MVFYRGRFYGGASEIIWLGGHVVSSSMFLVKFKDGVGTFVIGGEDKESHEMLRQGFTHAFLMTFQQQRRPLLPILLLIKPSAA
nr:stress-response A/B barrel domain-containing protein At5g22580 [Ipomoea batatas]